MERPDSTQIKILEDTAVIKEKILMQDSRMQKIESQLERIDAKLDKQAQQITQLETQNRVMKWVLGVVITAGAALIALLEYIK